MFTLFDDTAIRPDEPRGTGFGLYMTKNLLNYLGWYDINVNSIVGIGTSIEFDLPVCEYVDEFDIIRD